MTRRGLGRAMLAAAAIAGGMVLSACGSTLSSLPVIGEPAIVPPAPAVTPDSPIVGSKPPEPPEKPMTQAERAKVEAELNEARTGAATKMREQINQDGRR